MKEKLTEVLFDIFLRRQNNLLLWKFIVAELKNQTY